MTAQLEGPAVSVPARQQGPRAMYTHVHMHTCSHMHATRTGMHTPHSTGSCNAGSSLRHTQPTALSPHILGSRQTGSRLQAPHNQTRVLEGKARTSQNAETVGLGGGAGSGRSTWVLVSTHSKCMLHNEALRPATPSVCSPTSLHKGTQSS